MKPFSYIRLEQTAAAIKQVNGDAGAKFVGGGTNLIDFMKLAVETPTALVDINRLPLAEIKVTEGGARIGALVRNSDLAWHDVIRKDYPVLSEALLSGATPQIRNMATVGGNLLQRTRCTYFRDISWPCNKRDPGSGCAALEGDNRSHAVLGTSDKCIATHPSDMCVARVALEAKIEVQGPSGERQIPIGEFFVSYGEDPAAETVLERGDLITAVCLTASTLYSHSHYLKIRDRAAFEFALASVAAAMEIKEGRIAAARVALGGVATKPWRATEAEQALVGARPERASFAAAAEIALEAARPRKFNAFKIELAKRAMIRALTVVGQRHGIPGEIE
jgi:xanthine dehydrogenase YagS FAD-binding subunit